MTDLLVTVWHTGANYAMAHLTRGCIHRHCGEPMLETDAADAMPWVTTYRDPYLVGASWANRYVWKEVRDEWMKQWESYSDDVLPRVQEIYRVEDFRGPPLKSAPDKTGAKALYERGDLRAYFEIVPRDLVEFALEVTEDIRYAPV